MSKMAKHKTTWINLVEVYGLVADFDNIAVTGTDNYTKLQQAVTEVADLGGGVLYIPKGKYKITQPIVWRTNVSLIGDGMLSSMLYIVNASAGKPAIMHDTTWVAASSDNVYENCHFRDFGIDGINVNTTGTYHVWDKGIFMQRMRNCTFKNLYMCDTGATALGVDFLDKVVIDTIFIERAGRLQGTLGASGIGIGTNGMLSENFTISNCICNGCGLYGIFIEGQFNDGLGLDGHNSKGIAITNCITKGNKFGYGVLGCNYVTVSNCITYENTAHGIKLYNSNHIKFDNCISSDNAMDGISISTLTCTYIDFNNCEIFNNATNGIEIQAYYGLTGDVVNHKYITIKNCNIHHNTKHGINLNGGSNLETGANGSLAHPSFLNNHIHDNGNSTDTINSGLYISPYAGTIYNPIFKDNIVKDSDSLQDFGIYSELTLSDVVLSGNYISCPSGSVYGSLKGTFKNNYPNALNYVAKAITTLSGTNLDELDADNVDFIKYGNTTDTQTLRTINNGYNLQEITILVSDNSLTVRSSSNIKFYDADGVSDGTIICPQYSALKLRKYNTNWFIISGV